MHASLQVLPGAVFWQDQLAWNVTCEVSQLPNVTFVMSGQGFSVPPQLYVQEVSTSSNLNLPAAARAKPEFAVHDRVLHCI